MPFEVKKKQYETHIQGNEIKPMRATLEFELPEDHENYRQSADGMNWSLAMWDLEQFIRSEIKYQEEKYSEGEQEVFQTVRDKIVEIMNEYNLKYPT
jgi:hypothetical protein